MLAKGISGNLEVFAPAHLSPAFFMAAKKTQALEGKSGNFLGKNSSFQGIYEVCAQKISIQKSSVNPKMHADF